MLLILSSTAVAGRRVLFIGDSVTDGGWGRSGGLMMPTVERNLKDLNHIYGHSYMMLCAAHFESFYPEEGLEFINRGISGDDLTRLEIRWQEDAIDIKPDVLSLLIGTNDVSYHLEKHTDATFDIKTWEQRYRHLLDQVREANSNVRIILGTPFAAQVGKVGKASDYAERQRLLGEVTEVICRIANDYDAILLRYDILFAVQAQEHPSVPASHWIWDGIHPTAAGHQLMANLWITKFLGL
ncbi:MAG: SGNH/GDSL hydrolase family protein [Prevotella sp.]|nr:SGNH/GDSL hydrolase family protein [Prevotella sp.]